MDIDKDKDTDTDTDTKCERGESSDLRGERDEGGG
jgi:hypothetical protein